MYKKIEYNQFYLAYGDESPVTDDGKMYAYYDFILTMGIYGPPVRQFGSIKEMIEQLESDKKWYIEHPNTYTYQEEKIQDFYNMIKELNKFLYK